MYSFSSTVEIQAPVSRVWHALCDPAEVVAWDAGVSEALDAPADYPKPGQIVRWRYRSGAWPVLEDRPQEVDAPHKLRSLLKLGPHEMDETYTLESVKQATRLHLSVQLTHSLRPRDLFTWLTAGRSTRKTFERSLASLKHFCETSPVPMEAKQ